MLRAVQILRLFVVSAIVTQLAGCATLFSDAVQPVTFTSRPTGAEVLINGISVGRTPVTANIERRRGQVIGTLRANGYESKQFRLGKGINTVAIFNLTFLLSWATDFTSGKMFEYEPNSYYLELNPANRPTVQVDAKERMRQPFILGSRTALVRELLRGDGEFLTTLAQLYNVPNEQTSAFTARLRNDMPVLLAPQRTHEFYAVLDASAQQAAAL